jgi:predicted nucleotidyltransferase
MPRSNLEQLLAAAELLRPMLPDVVFVGGAIASLLVTDEGAGAPRPTLDVDVIAEISSYAEYAAFGERLRALGFSEDASEGAPLCRWVQRDTIVDVLPLDEKILGFSNRWHRAAMGTAVAQVLQGGLDVRVVTAPHFLATKIEAFHGRGRGDFAVSHDLEDLVFVIDGRAANRG